MANIVVSGPLGKTPEFFEVSVDGKPRKGVRFSVADSVLVKGKSVTQWYEGTVWANDAGNIPSENLFRNSTKGDIVTVQGRTGIANIYLDGQGNPQATIPVSVEPGGFTAAIASSKIQAARAAGEGGATGSQQNVAAALRARLQNGGATTALATPSVGGTSKSQPKAPAKKKGNGASEVAGVAPVIERMSDEEAAEAAASALG